MKTITPRIFVVPFGGTGSSFFLQLWQANEQIMWPRPDYPFSWGVNSYDLDTLVDWNEKYRHVNNKGQLLLHRGRDWTFRTGREPQADKTIRQNLVEFLQTTQDQVLLFGKQSLTEPFLTKYRMKNALFIVRDPIDSYDSLYGRRHSTWAKERGGIQSLLNVEHYCKQWNAVVSDMLSCREQCGNHLVRYETLVEDLREAGMSKFARIIEPMWNPQLKREIVTPKMQEHIRQYTWDNVKQIY